jgi:diguanylate cyclase
MPLPAQQTYFLTNAIRQLDNGSNSHTRWLAALHQALICGSEPEPSASADDGHLLCAFGRWFHAERPEQWQPWQADLDNIDRLHIAIHAQARSLLAQRAGCRTIDAGDYEAFTELTMEFKLALRALQAKIIENVCLVDQLTGVWNRSSMLQRLAEELNRMLRSGQPSCLCMMDLDHFKAVNDDYGHVAGDRVLQSATEVAKRCLRTYDSIFRYGGEEFLFCLPNISVDVATTAMDRVRAELEESLVVLGDGTEVHVTASFGVTPFLPDISLEENIETADRALFCAKAQGRNRVCRWD